MAVLALLAAPAWAQELSILPASFRVSPGERVTVQFRGPGAAPQALRDATIYTDQAAYNVTGLRAANGSASGGGAEGQAPVKAEGTLVLYAGGSGESRASAKALLLSGKPGAGFDRRIGLPLEIIPERDPYALQAGEPLPVRLLLRGKPASGCELLLARADSATPEFRSAGRTDAAGRLAVRLDGAGPWLIGAAREGLSTSLTFESF